jgi:hypothetical protein
MSRSEKVDLISAVEFPFELQPLESVRGFGVQSAARLRWNRCLSLSGTILNVLGDEESYCGVGCPCGFCFLLARGLNLFAVSLAVVGRCVWVAVQSGVFQREWRLVCTV